MGTAFGFCIRQRYGRSRDSDQRPPVKIDRRAIETIDPLLYPRVASVTPAGAFVRDVRWRRTILSAGQRAGDRSLRPDDVRCLSHARRMREWSGVDVGGDTARERGEASAVDRNVRGVELESLG